MKIYRVKIVGTHSDYIFVKGESEEEALDKAPDLANCQFEAIHDCSIVAVQDMGDDEGPASSE